MTVALIDAALRASILLAPALLWARFSRRSSAAARHAACFVTVLFAAAMPLLTGLLPDIEIAVLPAVIARAGGAVVPVAGGGWAVLVVGAWLLGALAFGARVLGGVARARTLCRWAKPVTDARVLSAAIRARRELGLEAPIRVLAQRRLAAPLSWGVIRPVILLPRGAKQWSRGRLRAVLLHELSHIRRRDCLTQLVADLACAVYWFHPLVWLAALRMRVERERACDDSVVVVGGRPSGYAVLLLRMVKGIPAGTHTARLSPATTFAASSFADGGELTGRLRALLGRARDRGSLTPAATLAFVLGALTLALPVAAVRLTAQAAAEPAASPATAPVAAPVAAVVTDESAPPAQRAPTVVATPEPVPAIAPVEPAAASEEPRTLSPELLEKLEEHVTRLAGRRVRLHPLEPGRTASPKMRIGFFGGFTFYVLFEGESVADADR